jgi:hypothetical protein
MIEFWEGRRMKKTILITPFLFSCVLLSQVRICGAGPIDANNLPAPIVTENSVEICMNSRYSQHSLRGTASMQQISNVVWAAGKVPFTGTHRDIYVATPDGTYLYDPNNHSLSRHSDVVTDDGAFAITYESERDFDTGVSFMPALLAAVSLRRSTESPMATCPKGLGYPKARLIFGVQPARDLTTELTAHCSVPEGQPGWLPDPSTAGDNSLEEILADLRYVSSFSQTILTLQQISQILWAGYGCTAHTSSNGRAGLTVPSAWANYYLTGSIYLANENGVFRYHNRNPQTNLSTRDHRLEQIDSASAGRSGSQPADARGRLQTAVENLPEAPCYIILCLKSSDVTDEYARLETGFVASNILMQTTVMNLGCHFRAGLTSKEQSDIRTATNIPSSHVPQAIVSIGPIETVVSISVALRGDNRPDTGWAIPLTVKFFTPGVDVFGDTPVYEFDLTTAKSTDGDTATCEATGVAPGTYDITARSDYTLMNIRKNVTISDQNTSVDMGTILEGNASLDNRIDLEDFAIFSMSWLSSEPQVEYDVRADFDHNNLIDIADLSILATNWLSSSPIEIIF